MALILVINPGSTSTKMAVYRDKECLWTENIPHSLRELSQYGCINDQLPMRRELVNEAIRTHGFSARSFDAVAARGGMLCPIHTGAYRIGEAMLEMLREHPCDQHASNLAAPIAYSVAQEAGIGAYIYDGITVDEMIPLVRLTGIKDIRRRAKGHNLNMRAAALQYVDCSGKSFDGVNMIVAHLGGGITVSLFSGGRIIDLITDDEGPFSPERAGGIPNDLLIDYMAQNNLDQARMMKQLKRAGGFVSHLGTSDTRRVEQMIEQGDQQAEQVYEALILSVAKSICKLAATVSGRVDDILLTGGIAHSQEFTRRLGERVRFIAPVTVIPGENEMQSLAFGVLRVLNGEEQARDFVAQQHL